MPTPGTVTGIVTDTERSIGGKITAWARTLLINGAAYRLPEHTLQRDTTRRRFIGAAHAKQRRGQWHGQFHRHAGIVRGSQISTMKINAKGGTTGTAGKTGNSGHRFNKGSANRETR